MTRVEVKKVPVVVEDQVIMTLSRPEAQLIRDIIGSRMSGSSTAGRFGMAVSILRALESAGIVYSDCIFDMKGSFEFIFNPSTKTPTKF